MVIELCCIFCGIFLDGIADYDDAMNTAQEVDDSK